jgi:rRNA maturation endonuclease Nob1
MISPIFRIICAKIEHTYNNANDGSILSVFATGTVIKLKINCYKCNKSILKSETACPHCGAPQE